ncbi:hypothetical protein OG896_19480 [Streptomyces sp. NBC_00669]|uniref:hypothetical protein n=1 Tax=Streptomyces sp. NBC_00669 TaxID=2976011 RepID=UPI002E3671A7|nr:hypothetical protein [Streptomyces sp. NBC_00669]
MCVQTTAPRLSLMAVGDLRDALTALELGQGPTAITALMSIDPESWQAIEHRLAAVGGDLRQLLERAGLSTTPADPLA